MKLQNFVPMILSLQVHSIVKFMVERGHQYAHHKFYMSYLFSSGEAAMAVRQQLSSMLYVKKICEAQIKSLKTGDVDTSVLNQVFKTIIVFITLLTMDHLHIKLGIPVNQNSRHAEILDYAVFW